MAESLYGIKDPSKTQHKPVPSSTSFNFSSNLSALISSSNASKANTANTSARVKPSKTSKSDLFTSHNRNVKKRSAADMEQGHQTKSQIGHVEPSEYHRSRRKMEEKVRMYNAMKRGEYIGRDDYDDRGLVDFDRKWADTEARGSRDSASEKGSDDDSENEETDDKVVEYTDEFGRLRRGTASEARREQREQRIASAAVVATESSTAHPSRPSNVIYGDTVQHQAFNPDKNIADKMEELAKKRDKEATPPPETHYDANGEIRNRGTGFYGFSKDEELRKQEMTNLEKERLQTEQVRTNKHEAKEKRKRELEERRSLLSQKKSQKEADRFLDQLKLDGT